MSLIFNHQQPSLVPGPLSSQWYWNRINIYSLNVVNLVNDWVIYRSATCMRMLWIPLRSLTIFPTIQGELPETERRPQKEEVISRLPEVPTEPPTLGRSELMYKDLNSAAC